MTEARGLSEQDQLANIKASILPRPQNEQLESLLAQIMQDNNDQCFRD
jgi:hypothetical protein